MSCKSFVRTFGRLTKAAAGDGMTYASPSSESALLVLLERAALADALAETFCATPRLFGEASLLGDGLEEGASEGDLLLVLLAGLEPSSSEESPPAKARSSASKSAIMH